MACLKTVFCKRATLTKPWRKISTDSKDDDLKYVKEFKPYKEAVEHIRIMLYGPAGSGKASFINTIASALQGRITGPALPDGMGHENLTVKNKTFRIKKDRDSYYPFVFTAITDLETQNVVSDEDIELLLKGHVKEGYKFDPDTAISSNNEFYNSTPTINDKTHVLVCVVPATSFLWFKSSFRKMRRVRKAAKDLGIKQMAILTKIDKACLDVQADLNNVYKSKIIQDKLNNLSRCLGITPNAIYPVKNYNTEVQPDESVDKLALMALGCALGFGDDSVDNTF